MKHLRRDVRMTRLDWLWPSTTLALRLRRKAALDAARSDEA